MDSENNPRHLVAKIQIGNAKGPITYKPGQTVFHQDDVKEDKRNRKNEIKEFLKSTILNTEHPWAQSVDLQKKPIVRERAMSVERCNVYKYNYRAEVIPQQKLIKIDKSKKLHLTAMDPETTRKLETMRAADPIARGIFPRMTEMPVHPALADKKPWNHSTEFLPKDKQAHFSNINNNAQSNSKHRHDELVKSGQYIPPIEHYNRIAEEVKRQKKLGTFTRDYKVFQEPPEEVDRKSLRNRFAVEASRKYTTTSHTGKWAFNKEEGCYMWTDTGSYEYDSPGDAVQVHNPDAYNFEGPTLAVTSNNAPRRIEKLLAEGTGRGTGTGTGSERGRSSGSGGFDRGSRGGGGYAYTS